MITNILFDFSRVILFPKDKNYTGLVNDLYRKIKAEGLTFSDYFEFNQELLDFIKPLKEKYNLSIFTTDIVQNDPAAQSVLKPIFTIIFAAKKLEISKKEPGGYLVIAEKLNAHPSEILFVDDGEANIKAASTVGLQTIRYFSNEQLFRDLHLKLQLNLD